MFIMFITVDSAWRATCDTAGIISPAVSLVVSHQVTEALKLLVEDYESLRDGLYRLICGRMSIHV